MGWFNHQLVFPCLTLRIIGPSNGRAWTCIAGIGSAKIASFEGSGYLGYKKSGRCCSFVTSRTQRWKKDVWLDVLGSWQMLASMLRNREFRTSSSLKQYEPMILGGFKYFLKMFIPICYFVPCGRFTVIFFKWAETTN